MNIITLLLVLLLIGALFPVWPYSSQWGYYPVGIVGPIVLIVLVVLLVRGD